MAWWEELYRATLALQACGGKDSLVGISPTGHSSFSIWSWQTTSGPAMFHLSMGDRDPTAISSYLFPFVEQSWYLTLQINKYQNQLNFYYRRLGQKALRRFKNSFINPTPKGQHFGVFPSSIFTHTCFQYVSYSVYPHFVGPR